MCRSSGGVFGGGDYHVGLVGGIFGGGDYHVGLVWGSLVEGTTMSI